MSTFSKLAETLIGSEIVRLGNMINERIRNGESIYNYTIGDFNPKQFPIPEGLEKAIKAAYDEGFTSYPPADGVAGLRSAVSKFVKEYYDLDYKENEIQIASGGRPLIYSIFKSLVDPGDKVIYAVPSWNNNHYVHMNEGEHCVIPATPENAFMPRPEDIAPHLPGATLLCLCTPQNPTGTTLTKESLEAICDLVLEENAKRSPDQKKLYVMFDQMYGTLTYGDTVHYTPVTLRPAMKEFTVFVDGISKCFAATGVRVGWSMGPAPLIAKIRALLTHIGAWAPMAEQVATARFLDDKEAVGKYITWIKGALEGRLTAIYEGFVGLKAAGHAVDAIAPQAALYLTIKLDLAGKTGPDGKLESQEDVTNYLLSEAKLAVVPFYAFGAEKTSPWYRLSVGTCDIDGIPAMLDQLKGALEKLS